MNRKIVEPGWRKSSYSNHQSACVEVRDGVPGVMPVRDSKTPGGPALVFPAARWQAFVASLRDGEL
ncbi:DUF397 domain-containing protein [Streptomyces sp. 4N509B]|uniref:DUF397 domain-containing protein n=1 Tax=Streptomyces sp. 4N509B TaxID=3457413 RepID=UPI003FD00BA0